MTVFLNSEIYFLISSISHLFATSVATSLPPRSPPFCHLARHLLLGGALDKQAAERTMLQSWYKGVRRGGRRGGSKVAKRWPHAQEKVTQRQGQLADYGHSQHEPSEAAQGLLHRAEVVLGAPGRGFDVAKANMFGPPWCLS